MRSARSNIFHINRYLVNSPSKCSKEVVAQRFGKKKNIENYPFSYSWRGPMSDFFLTSFQEPFWTKEKIWVLPFFEGYTSSKSWPLYMMVSFRRDVHMWSEFGTLICLRHLCTSHRHSCYDHYSKKVCFPSTLLNLVKLPSNTSTML